MRRSQTYKVEVFDQIPTLNEVKRASAANDTAVACRDGAPTEFARLVLAKMLKSVDHRRLHPAAEAMLELGSEDKMTLSACRSFHSL